MNKLLGGIAIWGIKESVFAAMLITLIEIAGLLLVLFFAGDSLKKFPQQWHEIIPHFNLSDWSGIIAGSFIAFYAFIGFEDIANIAEEVNNPEKNLPRAIFLALGVATFFYFLVAVVVIFSLPLHELAKSDAPFALIIKQKGYSPTLISLISLIAIVNGALVQIIMASRLVYGMSHQKNAPLLFSTTHTKTQTPIHSTLFIMAIIIIFALWLPIETLAKATNTIMLIIFTLINTALIMIKRKRGAQDQAVSYSIFFPIIGFSLSILFLGAQLIRIKIF